MRLLFALLALLSGFATPQLARAIEQVERTELAGSGAAAAAASPAVRRTAVVRRFAALLTSIQTALPGRDQPRADRAAVPIRTTERGDRARE